MNAIQNETSIQIYQNGLSIGKYFKEDLRMKIIRVLDAKNLRNNEKVFEMLFGLYTEAGVVVPEFVTKAIRGEHPDFYSLVTGVYNGNVETRQKRKKD
ncbi:hypothetical protein [Bacillus cereus]